MDYFEETKLKSEHWGHQIGESSKCSRGSRKSFRRKITLTDLKHLQKVSFWLYTNKFNINKYKQRKFLSGNKIDLGFFFKEKYIYMYIYMYIKHMHHLLCLFCTTFVPRHHKYISMNNMNIIKESESTCWSKIQYKFNF